MDDFLVDALNRIERLERAFFAHCRIARLDMGAYSEFSEDIDVLRDWLQSFERTGAGGSIAPPTQNAE